MDRLVFDTNVCGKISVSPKCVGIMNQLRARYKIVPSVNTLYELLLGLCRSNNDEYFRVDQRRFKIAIGTSSVGNATFVDHPLVFGLWHGPKIQAPEKGLGTQWFRTLTKLVLKAKNLEELKNGGVKWPPSTKGRLLRCQVIEDEIANGKFFYRTNLHEAKTSNSKRPDRPTWAKGLGTVLGVSLSDSEADALASALDAVYVYEGTLWQLAQGNFRPENNDNDWMDMNQLFYLADPSIEFITEEAKIRNRCEASPQSKRIVLLSELLSREKLSL